MDTFVDLTNALSAYLYDITPHLCSYFNRLHGGYQGLQGGMAMDAFVDLTSGLSETYHFSNGEVSEGDLFGVLYRGARTGAFMTCSRKVRSNTFCSVMWQSLYSVSPEDKGGIILQGWSGGRFLGPA